MLGFHMSFFEFESATCSKKRHNQASQQMLGSSYFVTALGEKKEIQVELFCSLGEKSIDGIFFHFLINDLFVYSEV